jgi:ecotin
MLNINFMKATAAIALLNLSVEAAMAGSRDELKAFPKQMSGHSRYVFIPETREMEDNFQIELLPGKVMQIDCNRHRLAGSITKRIVEGFGYDYYVFETAGAVAATRMGCPDNSKHEAFVAAQGLTVRYNSKLPVVVFAPEGYSVRFRLWGVQGGEQEMPKE